MGNSRADLADYIFARMTSQFGHRWTSSYGDNPRSIPGREWASVLAGLTRAQIDVGFEATRIAGSEWPPSAPHFLEMCLGIPSWAEVNHHIRQGGDLCCFSRAVWKDLDTFLWRQACHERADRILREAYERVRGRVMAREILPDPPMAEISHEQLKYKPVSPDVAKRRYEEINRLLKCGDR